MDDYIISVWERCFGKNTFDAIDPFGYHIKFDEYGLKTKNGWTINYIWPLNPKGMDYQKGSQTSINNLQILSNKANNIKGNNISGKINNIVFSVKKASKDLEGKNIGRMKIKIGDRWIWAYNHWEE